MSLSPKIKNYFLVLFFAYRSVILSQNIDSLKQAIHVLKDKDQVEAYLNLGSIYSENLGQPDSLLYFAKLAQDKSIAIKYNEGENKAMLNIGIAYQAMNNYDTSTVILTKLLSKIDKNNYALIGKTESNIGLNYRRMSDYKSAVPHYLEALTAFEKIKDRNGMALMNVRLSGLFTMQNQFEPALLYGRKAFGLLNSLTDPLTKVTILSTLSGVSAQIAVSDKRFIDSTISFAKMALELVNKHQIYNKGNQLCLSIASAYTMAKKLDKALEYCKEAMSYRNYLYPSEIINSYINFGDCYFNLKKYQLGALYLDSAKAILRSEYDPHYEMLIEERVYEYNKEGGNFEAALKALNRFTLLKDSIYSIEKSKTINELEQKYNKSENEKKINELNRINEIASLNVKFLVVGILAAILIIIVIIFFYRQSILKSKFKTLETEQRLNRARMNPHFFFNALASIQALSMEPENQKKVSGLISKFSKIMRQSLESTYDELATIEDEVSFLSNYLDLQKTRFNQKFDYKIEVDDNLEQNEMKVPSMLLQPFLENSIEHGFKNISYKGQLDIVFKREEKEVSIELKDNGTGFDTSTKHKTYPSRATQIITDRFLILNKQYGSNAKFEFVANPDGKGVSVRIRLPIIY